MWSDLIRSAGIKVNPLAILPIPVRKVMWHFYHLSAIMPAGNMHPQWCTDSQPHQEDRKASRSAQGAIDCRPEDSRPSQQLAQLMAQWAALVQNRFWTTHVNLGPFRTTTASKREIFLWKLPFDSLMPIKKVYHIPKMIQNCLKLGKQSHMAVKLKTMKASIEI